MKRHNHTDEDRGSVLVMVLVVSVVLSLVVISLAEYASTDLRYGQVTEARAGRLSAAQGAMDDTLEQMSLRSSLCTTSAGSAGVNIVFPETINDATISVNCQVVAGSVPPVDGFALVITGVGAPANSDPIFSFSLGGHPEIGGPVFVSDPARIDFDKETTIEEGNLWYPDDACAESDPLDSSLQYQRSTLTIPNLVFDPTTRGVNCVNRTWDELFGSGPVVADLSSLPLNPAHNPSAYNASCRVFKPGHYTSLPIGSNNYFMSGNYHFDNIGFISLQGETVTIGQTGRAGYPAVGNTPCDDERLNDPDTGGATVYTSGNTRFESRANSGLEISGRAQGAAVVALQVLSTSLGYGTPLLTADNGGQKELAMQGLLWAPTSSLLFSTVPSKKAAILRGGAVVASFSGGISNAATGFVIEVPTSSSSAILMLESTAVDNRGRNTVRVIADYRPSTGEVAVQSRRVSE